jgi:hypothetical protein
MDTSTNPFAPFAPIPPSVKRGRKEIVNLARYFVAHSLSHYRSTSAYYTSQERAADILSVFANSLREDTREYSDYSPYSPQFNHVHPHKRRRMPSKADVKRFVEPFVSLTV